MQIINKREVADEVLKLVLSELNKIGGALHESTNISIESYQNGREQGHVLCCCALIDGLVWKWIGFSENRNSDDVVVYVTDHINMQSIDEETYKSAKYFRSTKKACDYIVETIVKSFCSLIVEANKNGHVQEPAYHSVQ